MITGVFSVRLEPGGESFSVPSGRTLLQAADAAGVLLDSSCRNGTCRTCMCLMTQGRIAYRINWPGLSAEEKAEGWILPCAAFAQDDLVLQATPLTTL